jgi:hypothetical protein
MGYQTDWIGYLHVQPAFNDTEIEFINRVSHSIFQESTLDREQIEATLSELDVRPPRWHSNWTVCSEGCCLSYDGGDKANDMVQWLGYLMATFLAPEAFCSGKPGFEEFTCDHVLNGMVVGSRRDNRELYSITAVENECSVELLWPGVKEWSSYPPLAYQTRIDEFREWVVEHRLKEARDRVRSRLAEEGLPEPW